MVTVDIIVSMVTVDIIVSMVTVDIIVSMVTVLTLHDHEIFSINRGKTRS